MFILFDLFFSAHQHYFYLILGISPNESARIKHFIFYHHLALYPTESACGALTAFVASHWQCTRNRGRFPTIK